MQYIFSSFTEDLNYANKYLIAAYLQKDVISAQTIFNEWFIKGKALNKAFFKNLNLDIDKSEVKDEFQKHEI